MKIGTLGCNSCLNVKFWDADDLSDIEHIAPGKPRENADWDKGIYTDEYQNTIGNLTLLPEEINESASNKGWLEKYYYYKHLAETDVDKVTQLAEEAKISGISLKESVISKLRNATHNEHIVPIVNIGKDGKWDLDDKRLVGGKRRDDKPLLQRDVGSSRRRSLFRRALGVQRNSKTTFGILINVDDIANTRLHSNGRRLPLGPDTKRTNQYPCKPTSSLVL